MGELSLVIKKAAMTIAAPLLTFGELPKMNEYASHLSWSGGPIVSLSCSDLTPKAFGVVFASLADCYLLTTSLLKFYSRYCEIDSPINRDGITDSASDKIISWLQNASELDFATCKVLSYTPSYNPFVFSGQCTVLSARQCRQ
jgi:hypothetical protein